MRNAIALILYGIGHVLIWIVGIAVGILELLWLIQLCLDHQYVAAFVLFMIGTPIIYQLAYWFCLLLSAPFLFVGMKLNPELGE